MYMPRDTEWVKKNYFYTRDRNIHRKIFPLKKYINFYYKNVNKKLSKIYRGFSYAKLSWQREGILKISSFLWNIFLTFEADDQYYIYTNKVYLTVREFVVLFLIFIARDVQFNLMWNRIRRSKFLCKLFPGLTGVLKIEFIVCA